MRRIKLTHEEQRVEEDIQKGKYVPADPQEFKMIADAIERRKKDAVLNIRINRHDLESIKHKAKKLGIKYQTFISEILHRVAHG